jgi:PAS fold
MAISADLDAQRLLDAMDGIAYLVDAEGVILAAGTDSWSRFAAENSATSLTVEAVVGSSLFSHVQGSDVQNACRTIHDAVCRERCPVITYEYRCDAPDAERRMRMSISPVRDRSGSVMALYQSQIVTEAPRLALGLFSMERRAAPGIAYRRNELVVLCSFCHDVAWPIGAEEPDQTWIRIDEYYRRGGSGDCAVSHGVCPACLERLVAPNSG